MESAHINSHYCCLLQDLPDIGILQKRPEQTHTELILRILYCFHNLIFSVVSQELVKETWDLLIKHHLQESSKRTLEDKVMFAGCFHLNVPSRTVVKRIVGKQTVLLNGSNRSSNMNGMRELLVPSSEM